jgi:hypothetical protein
LVAIADDLREAAQRLREAADAGQADAVATPLDALNEAARQVGAAWSGSTLGYHARVYYAEFTEVPPGASFNSLYGLEHEYGNTTTGDWREYAHRDVISVIRGRAGDPDLDPAKRASAEARALFKETKADVQSMIAAYLRQSDDPLLQELKEATDAVVAATEQQYRRAVLPSGEVQSLDMRAITAGVHVPPHYAVQAEILSLSAPFRACTELAALAQRAATHIDRLQSGRQTPVRPSGTAVFIGHGGSLLWRELKDFIHERLGLPWDEFNRVPVAGTSNVARLVEMLDSAAIAFLVLTAEDEQADGALHARQNVVHEAGLFQGRLGFSKAIVVIEDGCEQFSNIEGLGQLRFPAGRISAVFEDVRRVLEREGLLND